MTSSITKDLERDGVVVLPGLLATDQLRSIQVSFQSRLERLRWNNFDGYEKTERYRHTVQDVLTLDQGFMDIALHPVIKDTLHEYLGNTFELVEAKGWKSLPTKRDFHGWHGDAWYDQSRVRDRIPREVKLGVYLTEVKTGGFVYVKGSHGKQHPKSLKRYEADGLDRGQCLEVTGAAGLSFLFDTSGIHRQNMPILEARQAVFYCYHDPDVPLQPEDLEYYRYHPLHLNAAFLGDLAEEDRRILGFGNQTNLQPGFKRRMAHSGFQAFMNSIYDAKVSVGDFHERVKGKVKLRERSRTDAS